MFRARLPRRALLSAAVAAAAAAPIAPKEKPSIYSEPEPQLVLIDTPSELEKQIGRARETVTGAYRDSYAYVQGWVDKWIGVEHAVERRIKSFKAPSEPLTPGVLYVGVATLTGSILARSRGLPTRLFLPPTLLLLSLTHFLPKTSSNIGSYISELEHTYAPRAARFTDTAIAHSQMTWEMGKDKLSDGRVALEKGVEKTVSAVQDATGLKLREALGWGNTVSREVVKAAEERGPEVVKAAEERGKEAVRKIEESTDGVINTVEKKVEEVKRLV